MNFSPAGLAANLLFSGIGLVAFTYGKRMQRYPLMGAGAALMAYPYFVAGTLALWLVGAGLTAVAFWVKDD